jgi:hypothetical protein
MAMCLSVSPAFAAEIDIEQEVRIGVYGTDGPNSPGDEPASQLEEYGEVNRGVVFEQYKLDAQFENYAIEADAQNLNQNTRGFKIKGGHPGKTSWVLKYDETPHLYTNEAQTLYQHAGGGNLRISSGTRTTIERANVAFNGNGQRYDYSNLKGLVESQPIFDVGVVMKTMEVGLKYHPAQDFVVQLDGMRVSKRGTRPQAAAFGFRNAIEVAAPVDEQVVSGGLAMGLYRKHFQLGFDYRFEEFENDIYTLTWDNPKKGTGKYTGSHYSRGDGSTQGQMAMAPDNKAHMLKLDGGFDFLETHRFSFEGGYQRWSSFNPMHAYTINPLLNPASAGAAGHGLTFDASNLANRPDPNVQRLIEVWTYLGKISGRPFDPFRWALSHEAYIMENKGKKYSIPGWAVFDQNWHQEATPTTPILEQIRQDKTKFSTEYDMGPYLSGNTSLTHKYYKRTREVDKGREYEAETGFTIKPMKSLWFNLGYLVSGRRASGWDFQHYPGRTVAAGYTFFSESPSLLRPDVADRNRHQYRMQMHWAPSYLYMAVGAQHTADKYRKGKNQDLTAGNIYVYPTLMGVLEDRSSAISFDLSVPVTEKADVDLFYAYDYHRQLVRSNQIDTLTNYGIPGGGGTRVQINAPRDQWTMLATEHTNVVGAAVTHRPVPKLKNKIGVDMTFTRSDNAPIAVGSDNSPAFVGLPTSRRVHQTLKASSQYKFTKNLILAANYRFDRFLANDFAYTDIPTVLQDTTGEASSIFLGADPIKNYNFHSLGMSVTYKF